MEENFNFIIEVLKKIVKIQNLYCTCSLDNNDLTTELYKTKESYIKCLKKFTENEEKMFFKVCVILFLKRFQKILFIKEKYMNLIELNFEDFIRNFSEIVNKNKFKVENDSQKDHYNNYISCHKESSNDDIKKSKRANYSKQVSKILKNWLKNNLNSPYPSETEKNELCELTGLDQTQINNWFINARRRLLPMFKSNSYNKK